MDYTSLGLQIQAYANRNDDFFVAQIPNFITQAISRIYSEAKSLGFESYTVVGQELVANQQNFGKLPANWKETISFSIIGNNQITYLLPRSLEFGNTYWPIPNTYGRPIFFANTNYNDIIFFPGPDLAYDYQLIYRGLPLFNVANPTNFLTERYPSLLLYASMLEATPFLRDDERVPVFESFYNRELQNINRDLQTDIIDRTSKRDAN